MTVLNLSKQLKQIMYTRNHKFDGYVHDLEIWQDSIQFNQWFNDGNWPFDNIFEAKYKVRDVEKIQPLYPFYFGLHMLYIGNRAWKDTLMVFTYYTGESKSFRANPTMKYGKRRSVSGLFDIAISTKNITNAYYSWVLDSVGYGRSCSSYEYNCSYLDGRLRFVKVKDPEVVFVMDPNSERVHIRRNANISWELGEALRENITKRIEHANRYRDAFLEDR